MNTYWECEIFPALRFYQVRWKTDMQKVYMSHSQMLGKVESGGGPTMTHILAPAHFLPQKNTPQNAYD